MNWIDNYWINKYGCTRNQYRRIVQNAPYVSQLDGSVEEWNNRKLKILSGEKK